MDIEIPELNKTSWLYYDMSANGELFDVERLCENFDSLVSSMRSYCQDIEAETTSMCRKQSEHVNEIAKEIDYEIEKLNRILSLCDGLESRFEAIEQIGVIVDSWSTRVKTIINANKEL